MISPLLLLLPLVLTICISSDKSRKSNVVHELFQNPKSFENIHHVIQMCRAQPPIVNVKAESYHESIISRTNIDGRHQHFHERIVTLTESGELPYECWEERGQPIQLPKRALIYCKTFVKYTLTPSAEFKLKTMSQQMELKLKTIKNDQNVDISTKMNVPGINKSYILWNGSLLIRFFTSFLGRALWVIMVLAGYQSVYESFWCQCTGYLDINLEKVIGMKEDKLRCNSHQKDE